ncbi:MAG: hypothetical protein AMJ56_07615 [Anaerolineae bacterium SG8_19]|nr:MAG: hypothetical protein AMJ56_07615 [Anaerolineae bacterium SG8_19]
MLNYHHISSWGRTIYRGYYYIHTWPDPKKPGQLVSRDGTFNCREFFIESYRDNIRDGDTYEPRVLKAYALVTLGRPENSLFDSWNNSLLKDSEKGLYIINSFEHEHKWPKTRLYKVSNRDNIPFMFFLGPRKWTMSPYLMSLWTLMMRIGRNSWIPKNLMELDHENLVRQLAINAKTNASGSSGDSSQTSATIRSWDNFMSLYGGLFGHISRKYHWDRKRLNGHNSRPEGIRMLLTGTTKYQELYRKYRNLLAKEAKT